VQSGVRVGATFDMGAFNTCNEVIFELTYANAHSAAMTFVINGTIANASPNATDVITNTTVSLTALTAETAFAIANNNFSTPVRYIHVYIVNSGADSAGIAGEVYARLRSVMLISDTTYVAANASVLTGDTIINDALDRSTILLNTDRTGITAPTFVFPSFALDGQKTAREVWNAVNAAQNWRSKIDERRRPIFEALPSRPIVEIGAWPGSRFDDASANSGDEIYNRVVVEGSGSDSNKVSVERTQGQQPGVALDVITSPAANNPTFAVNTTSWTPSAGTTMTRDTVTFNTTPASGRWDRGVGVALLDGDVLTGAFTGTFQAGTTYVLQFQARPGVANGSAYAVFGAAADSSLRAIGGGIAGGPAFKNYALAWTPNTTTSSVTVQFRPTSIFGLYPNSWWHIDTLVLSAAKPTLVDRRGFRRSHVLPIKSTLSDALGEQIGDTWLAAHKTTPLKGTVEVEGDLAVRQIVNGAPVPPERLLLMTGDLLRLSHRIDPDTGGQGRDGRIAEVTYTPADDKATVAIDDRRGNVEALLERLSVVTGQV
jgi:hypothetical protein